MLKLELHDGKQAERGEDMETLPRCPHSSNAYQGGKTRCSPIPWHIFYPSCYTITAHGCDHKFLVPVDYSVFVLNKEETFNGCSRRNQDEMHQR